MKFQSITITITSVSTEIYYFSITSITLFTSLVAVQYCLAVNYRRLYFSNGHAHILKAFSCGFALFTLEIVLPYLIDLGCTFYQVMSI